MKNRIKSLKTIKVFQSNSLNKRNSELRRVFAIEWKVILTFPHGQEFWIKKLIWIEWYCLWITLQIFVNKKKLYMDIFAIYISRNINIIINTCYVDVHRGRGTLKLINDLFTFSLFCFSFESVHICDLLLKLVFQWRKSLLRKCGKTIRKHRERESKMKI